MRKNTSKFFYGSLVVALAIIAASQGAVAQSISSGQKVKLNGLIISRDGGNLTMKTADSGNVVIVLTDDTTVEGKKGKLGLRKKSTAVTALIPGLKIQVEGLGNDQKQVVATKVSFSADDLQTAQTIQAGLNPAQQELKATEQQVQTNQQGIQANKQGVQANQQQIQANKQQIDQVSKDEADLHKRFNELGDYDVKFTATIHFAVNSVALSEQAKKDLNELATNAATVKGYLIQVAGFADTSGNVALNQKLSAERSSAVVDYLAQTGKIPLRHMLAPAAMGTSQAAASNETPEGRALNRRVEVKVLVNKGLAGN